MRSGISLYTVILLLLGGGLWNAYFLLLIKENLKSLHTNTEIPAWTWLSRRQKSINLRKQLINESELTFRQHFCNQFLLKHLLGLFFQFDCNTVRHYSSKTHLHWKLWTSNELNYYFSLPKTGSSIWIARTDSWGFKWLQKATSHKPNATHTPFYCTPLQVLIVFKAENWQQPERGRKNSLLQIILENGNSK